MASSVIAGIGFVATNTTGIIIFPGDYPRVLPTTIKALIHQHTLTPDAILIPFHQDRRGHPTLFPRKMLEALKNGGTLRDIIATHHNVVCMVPVDDPGIHQDVDTPQDYALLIADQR